MIVESHFFDSEDGCNALSELESEYGGESNICVFGGAAGGDRGGFGGFWDAFLAGEVVGQVAGDLADGGSVPRPTCDRVDRGGVGLRAREHEGDSGFGVAVCLGDFDLWRNALRVRFNGDEGVCDDYAARGALLYRRVVSFGFFGAEGLDFVRFGGGIWRDQVGFRSRKAGIATHLAIASFACAFSFALLLGGLPAVSQRRLSSTCSTAGYNL
jgi:hypothetical protein